MKQLILKLDEQANHSIVLEDLDQYRILVVEPQVGYLKQQLEILLEENTYAAGMRSGHEDKNESLTRIEAAEMKDMKKTKK